MTVSQGYSSFLLGMEWLYDGYDGSGKGGSGSKREKG